MQPGVIVVRRYAPLVGGRLPYAAAPPLIDVTATATDTNTVSVTVTERVVGAKRKLIVQASYEAPSGTQTVTGITYGGVALTHVVSGYDPTSQRNRVEIWYLDAPAIGTANVVVTWSGGGTGGVVAHSLYYAAQGAPDANASGGVDSGTTLAVNITPTVVDALVIDGIDQASSTTTVAPAAGQTEVYDAAITGNSRIAGSYIVLTAAATRSMSWTVTSGRGGIAAVAIAPDYTLTSSGLTVSDLVVSGTVVPVTGTVALGDVTVTGLVTSGTVSAVAGTITLGAVTVTGAIASGTVVPVTGTVALGDATITGLIASATAAPVAGTVALAAVTVTGCIASGTGAAVCGTIATGDRVITGLTASGTLTPVTGTIVLGAVGISGLTLTATSSAICGTVAVGDFTLTQLVAAAAAAPVAGTVTLAGVTVADLVAAATAAQVAGTIRLALPPTMQLLRLSGRGGLRLAAQGGLRLAEQGGIRLGAP